MSMPDPIRERHIGELRRGGGLQHFWMTPGSAQLPRVARAEGLYVWDEQGRSYLDCTSGPVTVNIGHGNPRVLAAMQAQAAKVCFAYPTAFESESNTLLANCLVEQAGEGFDRAFFVSSGSEAVEKALEFARMVALARGQGARHKFISRHPSYHGSTLGVMGLNGDSAGSALAPLLRVSSKVPAPLSYRPPEGFDRDSFARYCVRQLVAAIEAEGPESVLAYVMEPVMGLTGGAQYAPDFYYREVHEICRHYGVLLIFDEVISGAGRSGRFLASNWWPDARPDLVCLAKGLGGGYVPLGAFLAPAAMVECVVEWGGFHIGHTHKANPLACATGLAVLREVLEQDLMERAAVQGKYLRQRLEALKASIQVLGDVRGIGMLNAIELVSDQASRAMIPRHVDVQAEIKRLGLEHGLLIYARRTSGGEFGDWIMMTPPMIATAQDIDLLVERVAATLTAFQDSLRRRGLLA